MAKKRGGRRVKTKLCCKLEKRRPRGYVAYAKKDGKMHASKTKNARVKGPRKMILGPIKGYKRGDFYFVKRGNEVHSFSRHGRRVAARRGRRSR